MAKGAGMHFSAAASVPPASRMDIEEWDSAGLASVMIEKFADAGCKVRSKFLDLNHTSNTMILVSLMIPKFAPQPSLEYRRTSKSGH